jgi:glutaredoxin 3
VGAQPELKREMMDRSGQRTVPQIWINEQHIGGFTDLYALDVQGKLDGMLRK